MLYFSDEVTSNMIESAKREQEESHFDMPKSIIKRFNKSELDLLKFEFKKYLIHCVIEGVGNIFGIDGFDGSRKTSISTELSNPSTIYFKPIIQAASLGIPTDDEKQIPIIDLYRKLFPGKGKAVFLDRSWNNRAFVQYIYKYCTPEQYETFMEQLSQDLDALMEQDEYNVISFFFNISKKMQRQRLKDRKDDPNRNHRYSPTDARAIEMYESVVKQRRKIEERYSHSSIPFVKVETADKEQAMIAILKYILKEADYKKKSKKIDFTPDTTIIKANVRDILAVNKTRNN